jgi:lysine/ornithine N-monooxygenase
VPTAAILSLSGRGYADFHAVLDFAFTEFSEVRTKSFKKYCIWVIRQPPDSCYSSGVDNAVGLLRPAL